MSSYDDLPGGGRRIRQPHPSASRDGGGILTVVVVIALIAALWTAIAWLSGHDRTGPNEACVVYNGGWFDKKDQRQTLPASSGWTFTGFYSQGCRKYPTVDSPRRYIITSDPNQGDKAGFDFLEAQTADGFPMRLNAKISFHSVFTGHPNGTCVGGHDKGNNCDHVLSQFDARYGNRLYSTPDGKRLHIWNGDDGIGAFENVEMRPVVDNAVRESLLRFNCAELWSPCAYASSGGKIPDTKTIRQQSNPQSLVRVQEKLRTALEQDLATNLGCINGPSPTNPAVCSDNSKPLVYFTGFQVIVSKAVPDPTVKLTVSRTLASFADANKALADLKAANIKIQTNRKLQTAYKGCSACATQDILKAHPQPFAVGNGVLSLK